MENVEHAVQSPSAQSQVKYRLKGQSCTQDDAGCKFHPLTTNKPGNQSTSPVFLQTKTDFTMKFLSWMLNLSIKVPLLRLDFGKGVGVSIMLSILSMQLLSLFSSGEKNSNIPFSFR